MTNKAEAKKGLEHYDVYNSPFLELLTPFNKWWAYTISTATERRTCILVSDLH